MRARSDSLFFVRELGASCSGRSITAGSVKLGRLPAVIVEASHYRARAGPPLQFRSGQGYCCPWFGRVRAAPVAIQRPAAPVGFAMRIRKSGLLQAGGMLGINPENTALPRPF